MPSFYDNVKQTDENDCYFTCCHFYHNVTIILFRCHIERALLNLTKGGANSKLYIDTPAQRTAYNGSVRSAVLISAWLTNIAVQILQEMLIAQY